MSVQFPFGKKTVEFPYDPNELANRLQHYVDRRGKVLGERNSPRQKYLNIVLDEGELTIEFVVNVQAQGNGSHWVSVVYREEEVLRLSGTYTAGPHNTKVELYSPGKWEEEISDGQS